MNVPRNAENPTTRSRRIGRLLSRAASVRRFVTVTVTATAMSVVAVSALVCTPVRALSVDDARHLLNRTGFGAAPHEINRLLPLSRAAAVDLLLSELTSEASSSPPAFLEAPIDDYLQRLNDYAPASMIAQGANTAPLKPSSKKMLTHLGMQEMAQLRVWWLDQMTSTRSPLSERLALFWHGHFTSKYFDVLMPRLMFEQLQTIRQTGATDFKTLLSAMLRDPALLIFLDNAVSTRRVPNENLARELLELFTLGVGHYQERDIKEMARALVGNSVDFGGTYRYLYRRDQADMGEKTILGKTGKFQHDDAVTLLLEHPRTATYVTEKLYREFVATEVDDTVIAALANAFRTSGYTVVPLLRSLFLSDEFWKPKNRAQLVKSPIELLVGFSRSMALWQPDGQLIDSYAHQLGQQLFEPPSVQGWNGGFAWLNAESIMQRRRMVERLWATETGGRNALLAGPDDLIVRYAAEAGKDGVAQFSVVVAGTAVFQGAAESAAHIDIEGVNRPNPAWDTVVVPRSRLPKEVRDVRILFHQDTPKTTLFINWVQVDGKRMPAYLSQQRFGAKQRCPTEVLGGMYCSSELRFDIPRVNTESRAATLADRKNGIVNQHIENGTARMPLAMRPGARSLTQLQNFNFSEFVHLGAAQPEPQPLFESVLATSPLFQIATPDANLRSQLKALTLDPAYNLK